MDEIETNVLVALADAAEQLYLAKQRTAYGAVSDLMDEAICKVREAILYATEGMS